MGIVFMAFTLVTGDAIGLGRGTVEDFYKRRHTWLYVIFPIQKEKRVPKI